MWDIHWLSQKNTAPGKELLLQKLADRKIAESDFRKKYAERIEEIKNGQRDFLFEMRRFLMPSAFSNQFTSEMWWEYLLELLKQYSLEKIR